MPIMVTIAAVRAANPCADGLARLLEVVGRGHAENEPIALYVPSPADVSYVLWVLCYVGGEAGSQLSQRFACDVAEHVLPIFEARYPGDNRPRMAIETARAWLDGTATDEERWTAWSEAIDATATADATRAAADVMGRSATAAADAARVAADAASAASAASAAREDAQADERRWQMDRLNQMLKE